MPTQLPFKVSPAAEERLASAAAVPNMEPGVVRELRFEVYNKEGQMTDSFDEEHYSIAFDTPESWATSRSAVRASIAGREFWLPRDTFDNLEGKTLTLIRRYEGQKQAGKIQNVLVAAS